MRTIWLVRHDQESNEYRVERLDGMAFFHVFGDRHRDVRVGQTVSFEELVKMFDNPQAEISVRDWATKDVIQRIAEADKGFSRIDQAALLRKGHERSRGDRGEPA